MLNRISKSLPGLLFLFILTPGHAQSLSGFDCLIEPHAVTEISTREAGTLETFLVDRGELVQAGQELARLDSEIEQVAVELARAQAEMKAELEEGRLNVRFTRRQLSRTDELFQKKAISFHEKDKAETEAARASLQLRQAQERQQVAGIQLKRAETLLNRRTVRSPIDGVVVQRLLTVGESVEDRPILKLAQIDPLSVEVIVPVSHYGAIAVGMQAEVTPRYPGATVKTATVTAVDRVIDAASNTFGVRLELVNSDHQVPGGVRCEVAFSLEEKMTSQVLVTE